MISYHEKFRGSGIGSVDFGECPNSTSVAVSVRRLQDAKVAWLNDRYLAQIGVSFNSKLAREEFCDWLVCEYGVMSEANIEFASHMMGEARIFLADRYGGTGGAKHGGSGRAASYKFLAVKGIGKTPLIPSNVDRDHSTGLAWLYEAVREAIASSVASAELPHSSVPIVAILSTGLTASRQPGDEEEPTALIIRQNFIRPAHLERSIFFGSQRNQNYDQSQDALSVSYWAEFIRNNSVNSETFSQQLSRHFLAIAFQIGAARALRLWHDAFISSNCSISGASADFGAFTALRNWGPVLGQVRTVHGKEVAQVFNAYSELLRLHKRQLTQDENQPTQIETLESVEDAAWSGFSSTIKNSLAGFPVEAVSEFACHLRSLCCEQIRGQSISDQAIQLDLNICKQFPLEMIYRILCWLEPRDTVLGKIARADAKLAANNYHLTCDYFSLNDFVNNQISKARRQLSGLPVEAIPLGHRFEKGTLLTWYNCTKTNTINILLEVPTFEDHLHLFGEIFSLMNLNCTISSSSDNIAVLNLKVSAVSLRETVQFDFEGHNFTLKPPSFLYDSPRIYHGKEISESLTQKQAV
jgi:hypothetical protein